MSARIQANSARRRQPDPCPEWSFVPQQTPEVRKAALQTLMAEITCTRSIGSALLRTEMIDRFIGLVQSGATVGQLSIACDMRFDEVVTSLLRIGRYVEAANG